MNELTEMQPEKTPFMFDFKEIEGEQMVSSKSIYMELGVRHDNVKRTIERLSDREVITFTPMEETSPMPNGGAKQTTIYYLGMRDSIITVAQLSPEFCADLVDDWIRLKYEGSGYQYGKSTFHELKKDMEELKGLVKHAVMTPTITLSPEPAQLMLPTENTPVEVIPPPQKKKITRRPMTEGEVLRIIHLHQGGLPVQAIAKQMKRSRKTIYRTLEGKHNHLLVSGMNHLYRQGV